MALDMLRVCAERVLGRGEVGWRKGVSNWGMFELTLKVGRGK